MKLKSKDKLDKFWIKFNLNQIEFEDSQILISNQIQPSILKFYSKSKPTFGIASGILTQIKFQSLLEFYSKSNPNSG